MRVLWSTRLRGSLDENCGRNCISRRQCPTHVAKMEAGTHAPKRRNTSRSPYRQGGEEAQPTLDSDSEGELPKSKDSFSKAMRDMFDDAEEEKCAIH